MENRPAATLPRPSLGLALVPVAVLIALLALNVVVYGGSAHVPLILAAAVAAIIARWRGQAWRDLESGITAGIAIALKAILILLVVGVLIGIWIGAGIVPTMVAYGLELMAPSWFLPAACLICAVVSLATGSSWSTAGTVGVALIGVAQGLGIPAGMAAGAIISGAYFGDKLSPLSDTTNLAPAVAGAELFAHIRHLLYTTVPALLIAVVTYTVVGLGLEDEGLAGGQADVLRTQLGEAFVLHPLLLVPPLLVILAVILRLPALPSLLGGALLGVLFGAPLQEVSPAGWFALAYDGFTTTTGTDALDELLHRGGLTSMYGTVGLIVTAMAFGGAMERGGFLHTIAAAILRLARGTGSLITAVVATSTGMNALAPDQYLAIVVPGRMYRRAFQQRELAPRNLSRTLEDAGTMTSALIPWNTCGVFMAGVLLVPTLAYAPWAILNWTTPLLAILLGFTGIGIHRAQEEPAPATPPEMDSRPTGS